MSRIGKVPVAIPAGVNVTVNGQHVHVKGPKGELERTFAGVVDIKQEGEEIVVSRPAETRETRAHQGLVRSLVANMVEGCTNGFVRELEINGIGYRAEKRKNFIRFDLGYSHPIFLELPDGVDAEVAQTSVKLSSVDKELVGQVAAKIRNLRKPEPYKGKGVKYKEETIIRKAGKAGGK